MRLVSADGFLEISLHENIINTVVVENVALYSLYVNNLMHQCDGEEGCFILSENEKLINISKKMVFIMNPFDVNINDKRIVNKIHKEISEVINERYSQNIADINSSIISFFDDIQNDLPYSLDFDLGIDINNLLKLYGVRLMNDSENIFDNLINYLKVMKTIMGYDICTFINLKSFLDEKQLSDLFEFCCYNKIQLILFENYARSVNDSCEHCIVIDKELCIIEYVN